MILYDYEDEAAFAICYFLGLCLLLYFR